MGEFDGKIGAHTSRISAENDHAVGQQNRLFDIVRDDENGAGRHLLAEPQFEQLIAQVLGGEHVERGERLVHEKDFRLDDQSAGETDALLHASGKLFGIGAFKSIEADGIENSQGALVALDGGNAARFERSLHVIDDGEPWKKREALKDDGDAGILRSNRLAVPQHFTGGGFAKSGENAQQAWTFRSRKDRAGQ